MGTNLEETKERSGSFLIRTPSARDLFEIDVPEAICLTVVVLGASGDLAKKKTYPALFQLFTKGFFPENIHIVGYARTAMTAKELRAKIRPYLKAPDFEVEPFLQVMSYVNGQYDEATGFAKLQKILMAREGQSTGTPCGRIYYLALPPSVYPQVCACLKQHCSVLANDDHPKSFLRIVIEKPFGKDATSAESLSEELGQLFDEEQLYRIDHYLGKELTQNLMVMRFENSIFEGWWNRQFVSSVQITFKEPFGVEGRAGYFDQFGIIRDIIQNHLLQLMTLVAMEKPVSNHPDDIRDEKVKVLRCTKPIVDEDCVIGQYSATGDKPGYLDDPDVPNDSPTPTFASCVLRVHNSRWDGVPFILKAGKALNERKSEIRIQLKTPPAPLFLKDEKSRNELVMRLQPQEAIYLKMLVKRPGLDSDVVMSELDLSYDERYKDVVIPDAYERLILDVVHGDQQHFVRRDELVAAWKIFDPLLERIDKGLVKPVLYDYGSRGPAAADKLVENEGYVRSASYRWKG